MVKARKSWRRSPGDAQREFLELSEDIRQACWQLYRETGNKGHVTIDDLEAIRRDANVPATTWRKAESLLSQAEWLVCRVETPGGSYVRRWRVFLRAAQFGIKTVKPLRPRPSEELAAAIA